jgi:hypothetical protein
MSSKVSYWRYAFGGLGGKALIAVAILFVLFFLVGLSYPQVSSIVELKYLGIIWGVIAAFFFIGNYVAWKKLYP